MQPLQLLRSKIVAWEKASQLSGQWQANKQSVVFTNGCFDLIHYGHLDYLARAAALGDRLVIGLNDDASVSRLKGPHRPIKDLKSRQYLLAALVFIDLVVVFGEDTPLQLIQKLSPDVLVKGGDYTPDTIVGADYVRRQGGEVKVIPFVPGYSTTTLEEKIRSW